MGECDDGSTIRLRAPAVDSGYFSRDLQGRGRAKCCTDTNSGVGGYNSCANTEGGSGDRNICTNTDRGASGRNSCANTEGGSGDRNICTNTDRGASGCKRRAGACPDSRAIERGAGGPRRGVAPPARRGAGAADHGGRHGAIHAGGERRSGVGRGVRRGGEVGHGGLQQQ
jgi:hypothetical protein